jgi:hypothetical protein
MCVNITAFFVTCVDEKLCIVFGHMQYIITGLTQTCG